MDEIHGYKSFRTFIIVSVFLLGSRYRQVHSFGMVIFEIKGLSSADFGVYTCTATNKFGSATSKFELMIDTRLVEQRPKFTSQLEVIIFP
jgi:hypothetical protein